MSTQYRSQVNFAQVKIKVALKKLTLISQADILTVRINYWSFIPKRSRFDGFAVVSGSLSVQILAQIKTGLRLNFYIQFT